MKLIEINERAKQYFLNKKYKLALETLLEIKPFPKELIPNLAKCYYHTGNPFLAVEKLESLENKSPDLLIDLAKYYNTVGNFLKSKEIYYNLLRQDLTENQRDKIHYNLSWNLLIEGNFKKGYKWFQYYGKKLKAIGSIHYYPEIESFFQKWKGPQEKNVKLLYFLEAGLGDQIIFFRYASILKEYSEDMKIICSSSLKRLIENNGYECIDIEDVLKYKNYKYVCSFDVPVLLDVNSPTEGIQFPYIKCYNDNHFDLFVKNKSYKNLPKIGIKYFGKNLYEEDLFRTIPTELMKKLNNIGNVFSLFPEKDMILENSIDVSNEIRDWCDTYNLVRNMDFVVSSCTSLVHLSGSMNKKCYCITPVCSYFTWASDLIKWYDSVVVLKCEEYGKYDKPFGKMEKMINGLPGFYC